MPRNPHAAAAPPLCSYPNTFLRPSAPLHQGATDTAGLLNSEVHNTHSGSAPATRNHLLPSTACLLPPLYPALSACSRLLQASRLHAAQHLPPTCVRRPHSSNTCHARGVGRGCSTRPDVSTPVRASQSWARTRGRDDTCQCTVRQCSGQRTDTCAMCVTSPNVSTHAGVRQPVLGTDTWRG